MSTRKKNHRIFIFLMLVFIIPLIASGLLFYYHDYFSLKTTNHGTLVNPPINVKTILAEDAGQKKWQIIYVSAAVCDSQCDHTVYLLNQIKKALGKNSDRVTVKKMLSNGILLNNKIYLVDPMDNLFMHYPNSANPMDILKDVKHVLEVSQIG